MLTARQLLIFKYIVEEYIATAEPVGSKLLMTKYIITRCIPWIISPIWWRIMLIVRKEVFGHDTMVFCLFPC